MRLTIANWSHYQHYNKRNPPWIKLHRSLLQSRFWVCADDASRALAIASMLLASMDDANDGSFCADFDYIKRVAYLNTEPDFKRLMELGFLETDDRMLANASSMHTNALPETETETETETDPQPSQTTPEDVIFETPVSQSDRKSAIPFEEFWEAWPRKVERKKSETAWNRLSVRNQRAAMADFPRRFQHTELKFIPYPTTYIHGERWNDESERLDPDDQLLNGEWYS